MYGSQSGMDFMHDTIVSLFYGHAVTQIIMIGKK